MGDHEVVVRYRDARWKQRAVEDRLPRSVRRTTGRVVRASLMVGALAWVWLTMLLGSGLFAWSQVEGVRYLYAALRDDAFNVLWLLPVVAFTAVLDALILGLFAVALRGIAVGWRSRRGGWWLRLSDRGLELSDRMGPARLLPWDDVEAFMLVCNEPPGEDAGHEQVGYRLSESRRRTFGDRLRRLMSRHLRSRAGVRADGTVEGWWDRDADDAVALLTRWLDRHRSMASDASDQG